MPEQPLALSAPPPPQLRAIAKALRTGGIISFWVQLVFALATGLILLFALFSRNVDAPTLSVMGLLVGGSTLILLVGAWLGFRYTRFARRFRTRNLANFPSKEDTIRLVRLGIAISLVGLAIALLGTEIGIGILLVKLLVQPQGAMMGAPERVIRVLDVLLVLATSSAAIAHLTSNVVSHWLMSQIK